VNGHKAVASVSLGAFVFEKLIPIKDLYDKHGLAGRSDGL